MTDAQTPRAVLVLGTGAREHALAWALRQSKRCGRLIVAPGNPGLVQALGCEAWEFDQRPESFSSLVKRAQAEGVDFCVVGPDQLLADGVVDVFLAAGIPCFGPTAAAAQLEASKSFCKEILVAAGVSTARHFVATTVEEAHSTLHQEPWGQGWVLKRDGLALGKGVELPSDLESAKAAAERMLRADSTRNLSGRARGLVIEERLTGEELSWMAFCDGTRVALLEPARDFKRLREGDEGPNTGGMGAIAPVPGYGSQEEYESWYARVETEVFLPVVREMKRRGLEYRGLLYAGLMVNPVGNQISVLEFNARFGDPEAQVLLPRLDEDLLELMEETARGQLSRSRIRFRREKGCYVVAAAEGYPDLPRTGDEIPGFEEALTPSPQIFCGGVKPEGSRWSTHGGRVWGSLGLGLSWREARQEALSRLNRHAFRGMQARRDIGIQPVPIAILASGQGSNFEALSEAIRRGNLRAEIRGVISDRPDAPVLERARRLGIPGIVVALRPSESREDHEGRILASLRPWGVRWVVLAGFMRVLSPRFLSAFAGGPDRAPYSRIVNIHPSMLPRFPGRSAYQDAWEARESETGITIHLVTPGVDSGPILAQERVWIDDCTSREDVMARGLAVEHRLYAQTLQWVLPEEFRLETFSGGVRAIPL